MELPKDPTLNDVMLFMQQGFASVHTRMDGTDKRVDERFDGVDRRFDGVEEQNTATQESVQALATHMDERFDALMPGVASKDFVERKVEMQL